MKIGHFICYNLIHRSDLHTKISYRIQYILFYKAFQEFEYIYYSFFMLKLARNFGMFLNYIDLICIPKLVIVQHIIFYGALQKFEYINIYCSFLMMQISTKFWYVFKLHRTDLDTKIVIVHGTSKT